MADANLTAARLRELLDFNPETGEFIRRVRTAKYTKIGEVAGSVNPSHGYVLIRVDKKRYRAHRLAWLHFHGDWPVSDLDHINGDRADNRIANLREVAHSSNMQNRRVAHRNNKHGLLGVRRTGNTWFAAIRVDGETLYLGKHGSAEEAHQAYLTAKRQLHEGCTI